MIRISHSAPDLYRDYRAEVEGQPLTRALRRAVIVLCVVQTVFILVDWIVYPAQFWSFLPIRIGLNAILAVVFFWSSKRYALISSYATCFAGGAMLFSVVLGTGGASSDYYVGLVLLFIGVGVLAPLSARQGAIAIGTLFVVYLGIQIYSQSLETLQSSALSIFFLSAAAFEGVMCCAYLDKMRFGDFVQRRELETARDELKHLDEEKSRFTANVHHELRTPLTLMLAPIDAFLEGTFGSLGANQRSYLQSMRANGRRLLNLINNLLDLAKVESNQLEIVRDRLSIAVVVGELVDGAKALAERKGVDLTVRSLGHLPVVFADRDAIEKVLVNLIGNALKFTDRGGRILIAGQVAGSGGVEVSVSDSGVGLAPKQLERIFDRFAQVDSSNTRKHEGTGIGLSLAKELVVLHGGEIWAESKGLGQGSTIRVRLPIGERDAPANEDVLRTNDGSTVKIARAFEMLGSGADSNDSDFSKNAHRYVEMERTVERGETQNQGRVVESRSNEGEMSLPEILVVEDNGDMRRLLKDILSGEFNVRTASNGLLGLEAARSRAPSLILTDVMMPEMSGVELCEAVKNDPATSAIPVVLVTSKAESEMKIKGLEIGADDYVTKPFHPRELLARVRSLVKVHSLQGALKVKNALLRSVNAELEAALDELKTTSGRLIQAERLAAVGELAAGIAHEVNNPVNYASNALRILASRAEDVCEVGNALVDLARSENIGAVEIEGLRNLVLKREIGDATDSIVELVKIAKDGLDRTQRLVGDLRDFASPDPVEKVDLDVLEGLQSTINLMKHTANESGVVIDLTIDGDPRKVRGDPGALNQVFLNLIKNSMEAFVEGGGRIEVKVCFSESEVEVRFLDDGPGIPLGAVKQVFEPFFSTKLKGGGAGMGLAISKRIVSDCGGTLAVEANNGGGAVFVVCLPSITNRAEGGDGAASC